MSWNDRGPWEPKDTFERVAEIWKRIEAGDPHPTWIATEAREGCGECGECGEPLGPGGGVPVWHHLATGEDKRQELCAACAARGRVEGWVLPDPEGDEGDGW